MQLVATTTYKPVFTGAPFAGNHILTKEENPMSTNTKSIIEIVHALSEQKPVNGFINDEHGNQIRVANIKEHDLIRDRIVRDMSQKAALVADEIQALKTKLAEQFENHVQQMAKLYQVKLGGKKGNVQLMSYDKRLKIERSRQDRLTTNDHMVVATQLVDQCLGDWSKGSNKNLQAFVRKYFRTDAQGKYNIADLQRVRKLKLTTPDPLWDKAMLALDNAIEFDFTTTYFRAFYRDDSGRYLQIPLDIAKA
jgi:hypothetical protein